MSADRAAAAVSVPKLATGIAGFDSIAQGGVPQGRSTLIAGTPGSAKTVFAGQFLAAGITGPREPGVLVTCEESPDDLRRNFQAFGWDIARWEQEGYWTFVDASPAIELDAVEAGPYDLGGLIARVKGAVERTGAKRLAIDSLGAIFSRFPDVRQVRWDLFRIAAQMKRLRVTSVMTAERESEYGMVARHGVEEFVADNVVILRNILEAETRRRTVEILKFRGAGHQKGEYPFTILPEGGVVVIPLSAMELTQRSSQVRITSGNEKLDAMCGGGIYRDSIVLVSGATGTGKTLMATEFTSGGLVAGERCLLLAFEESRDQLIRNARGWDVEYEPAEQRGDLLIRCEYPEAAGLEDHLVRIKQAIDTFRPHRVVLDSLTALERVATARGFREFVIGLTSFIKERETAGLFTASTPSLMGGASVTEAHISTLTDSIILLRYVEMGGEVQRGLTVLKMRGAAHEKSIRQFTIDQKGMHIGEPFRGVEGILEGHPNRVIGHVG
ncbi:circadian clock protein KaiC [Halorhodospira abdelmalekii]|uniref:circadian clock protein KaiC n=1 Tax=Halorhodospira abdelmalekii TaxID=421629 RepID=UPI0019050FCF|nr:circadian clock protein KaiC [Halorhodospira abdelmalekii]MBK1734686.1 circadian clock protein KaiC [Halorhodospira abdelmalekii]